MIDRLTEFSHELRAVGIPVSMVEVLDAARAMEEADLRTAGGLRAALGATMVKSARHRDAFERAFDIFFVLGGSVLPASDAGDESAGPSDGWAPSIADALDRADRDRLIALIREAVERFGRVGSGSSSGGSYFAYRVLRRLGVNEIRALLSGVGEDGSDPVSDRIARDRADRLMEILREEVKREVLRRISEERGVAATARAVREPLIEDLDLQHATRGEIDSIKRVVAPLARRLATRLSQRRRHGSAGRLDVRRTIRRSLAHGGAFIDPRFRRPRVTKPQIVLLCDTSGSMSTFSRFAMQLTHAIASELSGVRSFVFIEGVDEVTGLFGSDRDFDESLARMAAVADVSRGDGHSDYGRAMTEFARRYPEAVTARTTVIITGDARSNYRPPAGGAFRTMVDRARAVFWLNPEPERFWDTGDSVMSEYSPWCDRVEEVRSLRHLERFVEAAVLPDAPARRRGRVGRTTPLSQLS